MTNASTNYIFYVECSRLDHVQAVAEPGDEAPLVERLKVVPRVA